jgi:light-regulated signal transduction histidine kinase (bacteriophytochrome)
LPTDAAPGFLQPGEPIDLDNCAREPIHLAGAVQGHGAVLVARISDRVVTQMSANAAELLGLATGELIGRSLDDLVGVDAADRLEFAAAQRGGPRVRPDLVEFAGRPFDTHAFAPAPGLIGIDLEPAEPVVPDALAVIARVSRWSAYLQEQQSIEGLLQEAAAALRELTGFSRAWAYRFEADGHGVIVAEDSAPGLESYLGLHFPESDIPEQARRLYLANGARVIGDTDATDAPLVPLENPETRAWTDLSGSGLRAVSPIHIRYLRNMGVRSSLSVPIVVDGQLWGLLSAHAYAAPVRVSIRARAECEMLGAITSMQLGAVAELSRARDSLVLREMAGRINDQLASHDSFVEGLTADPDALLGLCRATGAIVAIGGEVATVGAVPPERDVELLLATLAGQTDDLLVTERLIDRAPHLDRLVASASGIIAFPLSRSRGNWVVWLRPEHVHEVTWGNRDQGLVRRDPAGALELGHRESFERWVEEVRGCAAPWTPAEIDAVSGLRTALGTLLITRTERLARLNDELARSNDELDAFAYAAAHDLREPVRGIEQFADFLLEDAGEEIGAAGREHVQTILRLTHRMDALLSALLKYAQVGESSWSRSAVHLPTVVDEVRELLSARIPADTTLQVEDLTIQADEAGVRQLLLNLIWNAVKYSPQSPTIDIGGRWLSEAEDGAQRARRSLLGDRDPVALYVRDRGIGIAPEHHEEVFQLFRRLHPRGAYGGGYGAGLTLARRIVERHGGVIWIDSADDQGTTVNFTLEAA